MPVIRRGLRWQKASNSEARSRALHAPTSRRKRSPHRAPGYRRDPFRLRAKSLPERRDDFRIRLLLPFRASRLTKRPQRKAIPSMMRQARNRNCCFACRNRGRHAPRRGADREAKEKAHRRNGRTSRKMTPKAAQAAGGSGLCLDE